MNPRLQRAVAIEEPDLRVPQPGDLVVFSQFSADKYFYLEDGSAADDLFEPGGGSLDDRFLVLSSAGVLWCYMSRLEVVYADER